MERVRQGCLRETGCVLRVGKEGLVWDTPCVDAMGYRDEGATGIC